MLLFDNTLTAQRGRYSTLFNKHTDFYFPYHHHCLFLSIVVLESWHLLLAG